MMAASSTKPRLTRTTSKAHTRNWKGATTRARARRSRNRQRGGRDSSRRHRWRFERGVRRTSGSWTPVESARALSSRIGRRPSCAYSIELFSAMVSSSQTWYCPAVDWLSPNCVVARQAAPSSRQRRRAVRVEPHLRRRVRTRRSQPRPASSTWNSKIRAFAYAEERMRADTSRLAVSNRASETGSALIADLNAKDIDGAVDRYSSNWCTPIVAGRRSACDGFRVTATGRRTVCGQYSQFEGGPLAVRGDNLRSVDPPFR